MSRSREQLISYLKTINVEGKKVLDAGAGPKDKWVIRYVKGEPLEYKTLDIDKSFGVDYCFDLNKVIRVGKRFDYVFCIETIEHLWNPVTALENLIEHAKEKIFISVPLINPIHDTWDYLRFTGEWFEKAFAHFGIKDVKVYPRIASVGAPFLTEFFRKEGLRMSKIRLQKGEGKKILHIGYFIEATKENN